MILSIQLKPARHNTAELMVNASRLRVFFRQIESGSGN